MRNDFIVQVADCAGIYSETSCTDFAHALTALVIMTRAYPRKWVGLIDRERVDLGCSDGLTELEREAVDRVLAECVSAGRTALNAANAEGR